MSCDPTTAVRYSLHLAGTCLLLLTTRAAQAAPSTNQWARVKDGIQRHDVASLPAARDLLWSTDLDDFQVASSALLKSNWPEADKLIADYIRNGPDEDRKLKLLASMAGLSSTDRFKPLLMSIALDSSDTNATLALSAVAALSRAKGPDVEQCLLKIAKSDQQDRLARHNALLALSRQNGSLYTNALNEISQTDREFHDFHLRQVHLFRASEEAAKQRQRKPVVLSDADKAAFTTNLESEIRASLEQSALKAHDSFQGDKQFFSRLQNLYRKSTDVQFKARVLEIMGVVSDTWCDQFIKDEFKSNPTEFQKVSKALDEQVSTGKQ